ncbi:MAG: hypothetical protein PVF15_06720 [Candidatus Bathyarchaeota archaeon]|jgi:hypothetical protein
MLPFESPLGIPLIAATAIIIVLYAILLIKLDPRPTVLEKPKAASREPKKSFTKDTEPIERTETHVESPKTPPRINDYQPSPEVTQPSGTIGERLQEPTTMSESAPARPPIETHVETAEMEETQKPKEDEESKKSFFLFGEKNFEGCSHTYGYLNSLPKNTPIPDECFGCPQIVECLRNLKVK